MVNKSNFDNSIKQELALKASEAKPSNEMLSRIINRIEDYEGGKKSMLKDKISNIFIKKLVTVSLCAVLVLGGVMFTFSEEVRAATLDVVKTIKTIFVLEKTEDGYAIVEKTTQDPIFQFICTRTSPELSDIALTDKMGFSVHFPKALNEEFKLDNKSDSVGIKKKISLEAWKELKPDVLKAINDEAVFRRLSEYDPYRSVSATYRRKAGACIFIGIDGPNSPTLYIDKKTAIKTKVGNIDAYWIEGEYYNQPDYYTKPKFVSKRHTLIWETNEVRYQLNYSYYMQYTMEDAVKFAETFMAKQ